MASIGNYKEAMQGKAIDELPLIKWDEAAVHVGGGDRDVPGLVSILAICFEDIVKPTQQILKALADFFAEGALETSLAEDPNKKRSVTWVVRFYAHQLKSTAGAPLLWRLAKAAEQVELPLKPTAMKEDAGEAPTAEQQKALLTATFKENTEHPALLRTLADESIAALQFIVSGMWAHVGEDEKEEVQEELEEEDMEGVTQAAVDEFKASVEESLASIGVQAAAASAEPVAEAASAPAE